jgi:hypothetical protein
MTKILKEKDPSGIFTIENSSSFWIENIYFLVPLIYFGSVALLTLIFMRILVKWFEKLVYNDDMINFAFNDDTSDFETQNIRRNVQFEAF